MKRAAEAVACRVLRPVMLRRIQRQEMHGPALQAPRVTDDLGRRIYGVRGVLVAPVVLAAAMHAWRSDFRHGSTAIGQLVGLFWRPLPWLIVRADYTFATRRLERLEPGLHGSLSILL